MTRIESNPPAVGVSSAPTPGTSPATIRHLNQIELSRRWAISPRTLERWRWLKQGPCYLKIMGRVVYPVEDIEAFESASRREIHAARRLINTKA